MFRPYFFLQGDEAGIFSKATDWKTLFLVKIKIKQNLPTKHFLFSKTPSRRLEDVFSVTLFVFQDLLKTSWRRLQDVFAIRLPKMSSRRLQDVFAKRLAIMSSRRLQDVLEDKKMLHWRRLQYVFTKTNVCWVGCLNKGYNVIFEHIHRNIRVFPRTKKSAFNNDWENITAYWENSKQSEV